MNDPDDALIAAHAARSLVMTGMVLLCTLGALAMSPHLDLPWPWVAGAWTSLAALSFIGTRTGRRVRDVPIGAYGDCRVAIALPASALIAIIPDRTHSPDRPVVEGLAPADAMAVMHDWGVAMLAQGFAVGLAPAPFACLFIAALLCGAADGAWTAMAMRHGKLTFVKALVLFVRAIRSGEGTGWRIVAGGRS